MPTSKMVIANKIQNVFQIVLTDLGESNGPAAILASSYLPESRDTVIDVSFLERITNQRK